MAKNVFTQSENMSKEYCCTVVRLGEILPIEGALTVAKTEVKGRTIVVAKNCKSGDLMFYCSNQSQLNEDFLSINNLYQDYEHNANADEVTAWLNSHQSASEQEINDYKRKHRGYFNCKSQVRMTKLAGEISMGFLFGVDELVKWCPMAKDFDFDSIVGTEFDTVNGELFIQAYVPPVKEQPVALSREQKRNKKLLQYNRMIPGQFSFHYDTNLLECNMHRINPDHDVTISVKLHGTSFIIGNVLCKKPKFGGLYERMFLHLPKFLQFTKNAYDVVYSSRKVIQNANINTKKHNSYEVAPGAGLSRCFNKYYEILKEYIPEGITIYGEIVGYVEGTNSFIQKIGNGYDFKMNPGENQLMIYRVTERTKDGQVHEYEISEVLSFTHMLRDTLIRCGKPEYAARIRDIDVLYTGPMKDLYPDIPVDDNWRKNVLDRLKNDKNFKMEELEPFCRLKVPREGIVLRINGDVIPEAFKLKCLRFLQKEGEAIDKQEYAEDAEMAERYA